MGINIRYWTGQTLEAWESFIEQGYLVGSSKHAGFPEKYQWMMEQMKKRIPNYNGDFPIWLSLHNFDENKVTGYMSGEKYVKLELELDERNVLVSDFNEWSDYVLNDLCIKDNAHEEELFLFAEDYGLDNVSLTRSSWEKIFDLNRERSIEDIDSEDTKERFLQGVTGRVEIDRVKKVDYFTAQ